MKNLLMEYARFFEYHGFILPYKLEDNLICYGKNGKLCIFTNSIIIRSVKRRSNEFSLLKCSRKRLANNRFSEHLFYLTIHGLHNLPCSEIKSLEHSRQV